MSILSILSPSSISLKPQSVSSSISNSFANISKSNEPPLLLSLIFNSLSSSFDNSKTTQGIFIISFGETFSTASFIIL